MTSSMKFKMNLSKRKTIFLPVLLSLSVRIGRDFSSCHNKKKTWYSRKWIFSSKLSFSLAMLLINSKFPGWPRCDQSKVILLWFTSNIYGTHPGYFCRLSSIPRLASASAGWSNWFLRIQGWHSTEMPNIVNQEVYIMKLHSFTLINHHDEHCIIIALALTNPIEIWISPEIPVSDPIRLFGSFRA